MVAFTERILCCVWYDRRFRNAELHTTDGEPVRILSTGRWNRGAGPDFLGAKVRIGDRAPIRGDVELHLDGRDWYRHGHHRDRRFDRTVLHVVLSARDLSRRGTRRRDGTRIPTLEVRRALPATPGGLARTIDPSGYPESGAGDPGLCRGRGDLSVWRAAVEGYGWRRILKRSEPFARAYRAGRVDAVLYRKLLRAMGYRGNEESMERIARRVPWGGVRRRLTGRRSDPERLLGAWLLAAGWLPEGASRARLRRKGRALLSGPPRRRPLPLVRHQVRPGNDPLRRLAALARMLAGCVEGGIVAALRPLLDVEPSALGTALPPFERALLREAPVGRDRVGILLENVFLPALVGMLRATGRSRRLRAVRASLSGRAAGGTDTVVRFVLHRMGRRPADVGSRLLRQGLHHLHRPYCAHGPDGCKRCPLPAALASSGSWFERVDSDR